MFIEHNWTTYAQGAAYRHMRCLDCKWVCSIRVVRGELIARYRYKEFQADEAPECVDRSIYYESEMTECACFVEA